MHRLTVVDSFTDKPFTGNPAAVCILEQPIDDDWMQAIAREMNLAETAFLLRDGNDWGLRWMTPTVEVDLCGHATLAAAHVLWTEWHLSGADTIGFQTRSGRLTATQKGRLIWLDFPSTPPRQVSDTGGMASILGAEALWVGHTPYDYLIELQDEETVRHLTPDLSAIARLGGRGMIVTSQSTSKQFDFVSRFFAPAVGIPEDPVTGSAHCALSPYWSARLGLSELTGGQLSSRGGTVRTVLMGDRVRLGGHAVTMARVEMVV